MNKKFVEDKIAGIPGGAAGALIFNGVSVPFDSDGIIGIEIAGKARTTPDPDTNRVQIEILNENGGSETDPSDPVGWGNWTIGDIRFLPSTTIAPSFAAKCDGTYYRLARYPLIADSPHITLVDHKINLVDASATFSTTDDGVWDYYSSDTSEAMYWGTQRASGITGCPAGLAMTTPGNSYIFNNLDDKLWLDKEAIIKFPQAYQLTKYDFGCNPQSAGFTYGVSAVRTNAPTTIYRGICSWDMYGLLNPEIDPLNQQDSDFELIHEYTNYYYPDAVFNQTTYVPFLVSSESKYYGLKMVIKKLNRYSTSFDPATYDWGTTAASTDQARMFGWQIYTASEFQVPDLPEENNGVAGIWCIKLREPA